jgi:hypothetical protein
MTRAQMESTQVHMFYGDDANEHRYSYRVSGFSCSDDVMSMESRVGVWDMVLVNASRRIWPN